MFILKNIELILAFLLYIKLHKPKQVLPFRVNPPISNFTSHSLNQLKFLDEDLPSILPNYLRTCLVGDVLETLNQELTVSFVFY